MRPARSHRRAFGTSRPAGSRAGRSPGRSRQPAGSTGFSFGTSPRVASHCIGATPAWLRAEVMVGERRVRRAPASRCPPRVPRPAEQIHCMSAAGLHSLSRRTPDSTMAVRACDSIPAQRRDVARPGATRRGTGRTAPPGSHGETTRMNRLDSCGPSRARYRVLTMWNARDDIDHAARSNAAHRSPVLAAGPAGFSAGAPAGGDLRAAARSSVPAAEKRTWAADVRRPRTPGRDRDPPGPGRVDVMNGDALKVPEHGSRWRSVAVG
jgi:hypothetical protein